MNAGVQVKRSGFSRKVVVILVITAATYLWRVRASTAAFNDDHYTQMRHDMDRTLDLPDGSPEQAVAYMCLGRHLRTPIYASLTGFDVCHWVRDPRNPLRPLFRRHPQLKHDWDFKCDDGFSNADHYNGFVAGPVSSARTLFAESAPECLDQLNALLTRHAGTDPASLDRDAQERLLQKALVSDGEGRALVEVLTSRRNIAEQTRGYRKLAEIAGLPGLALRWVQGNILGIVVGFLVFRTAMRGMRAWRRARTARLLHRHRLGLVNAPILRHDPSTATIPHGWPKDFDPNTSGELQRELAV